MDVLAGHQPRLPHRAHLEERPLLLHGSVDQHADRRAARLRAACDHRDADAVHLPCRSRFIAVTWGQVKRGLDPPAYAIHSVPQLLKKSKARDDYCEAERSPLEAMARLKQPPVSTRAA